MSSAEGPIPHVLLVDDNDLVDPSKVRETLNPYGVETRVRHPEVTEKSDVDWADLVIVDYFLQHWNERDSVESMARAPFNGLAVAAALRSSVLPPLDQRQPGKPPVRAVAFALLSGNLAEATFGLPTEVLPQVFSRENNLEWTFGREQMSTDVFGIQVGALAKAVTGLPQQWPSSPSAAEVQLIEMLGLAEQGLAIEAGSWQHDAEKDVLLCRPPIHELSARSHGLALVRWMLHRILPYPCFLLDEQQLCARLRVETLTGGATTEAPLLEQLRPYLYTGTLAGFDGDRWWRAGIEDWLFERTGGVPGDAHKVAELALSQGATSSREWLRPVIVITGDLARSPEFAEVEHTVRVQPDDWPVFADDAFALQSLASEDETLRALVVPADRELLTPIDDNPSDA